MLGVTPYMSVMNRREFTASLAALAAAPALPFAAPAVATTAPIPAGAYAWAQLIARAQAKCTPAMLARHLSLDPAQAQTLFAQMIRDNVLRAPGLAGSAQAVQPINATGQTQSLTRKLTRNLRKQLDTADRPAPLVKDEPPRIGCPSDTADTQAEETPHARPNEPLQKGPRQG